MNWDSDWKASHPDDAKSAREQHKVEAFRRFINLNSQWYWSSTRNDERFCSGEDIEAIWGLDETQRGILLPRSRQWNARCTYINGECKWDANAATSVQFSRLFRVTDWVRSGFSYTHKSVRAAIERVNAADIEFVKTLMRFNIQIWNTVLGSAKSKGCWKTCALVRSIECNESSGKRWISIERNSLDFLIPAH